MVAALKHMYIFYSYMEPLGVDMHPPPHASSSHVAADTAPTCSRSGCTSLLRDATKIHKSKPPLHFKA